MASYVFHDEAHIPLQAHEGLQDLATLLSYFVGLLTSSFVAGWRVAPQKICPPGTYECDLTEKRLFEILQLGPNSKKKCLLLRRREDTDRKGETQSSKWCEHACRDWNDRSTNHRDREERRGKDSVSEFLGGTNLLTPRFQMYNLQNLEKTSFFVLSYQVCGHLLQQPWKTNISLPQLRKTTFYAHANHSAWTRLACLFNSYLSL